MELKDIRKKYLGEEQTIEESSFWNWQWNSRIISSKFCFSVYFNNNLNLV